jgi:hypothetical protein
VVASNGAVGGSSGSPRSGVDIFGGLNVRRFRDKAADTDFRVHHDRSLDGQSLKGETKWVLKDSAQG